MEKHIQETDRKAKTKKSFILYFILWLSVISFIITGVYNKESLIRSLILIAIATILIIVFNKKIDPTYVYDIHKEDSVYYIASALICLGLFIYSCKNWNTDYINRLINTYNPYPEYSSLLIILLSAVFSVFSYIFTAYALKYFFRDFLKADKNTPSKFKPYIKPCLILIGILCFCAITIIRANYVYKDDMQRIVTGETIYTRESRNLAELILSFLETDTFFADISPLTQILELSAMAVSAMVLFAVFTGRNKVRAIDIAAMIPFCFSPLFLECISFKYDAPQHGMAVLFAVLPLLVYKSDSRKYIVSTIIGIYLSCSCHQVPMTLFPAAVIVLCIINRNLGRQTDKELLLFIRDSAIGYLVGLILYKLIIMQPIGYNTELTTLLPISRLIPGMIDNYIYFFKLIKYWYHPLWLVLIAILCAAFYCMYTLKTVHKRKIKAALLNAAGCIVIVAMSNSLYPLLEGPLHSPRHMYSFGLFVGMAVIATVSVVDTYKIPVRASALILGGCFAVFGIKYGNLLSYQADYTSFRCQMVAEELSTMAAFQSDDPVEIQIIGTTGYSPVVASLPEKDTLLRDLVTTSFNEYFGLWNANDLVNLYGLNVLYTYGTDLVSLNMPKTVDNYYYNIYSDGEKVLIELKERSDCLYKYFE